jgi:hypothetical protein
MATSHEVVQISIHSVSGAMRNGAENHVFDGEGRPVYRTAPLRQSSDARGIEAPTSGRSSDKEPGNSVALDRGVGR